MGGVNGVRWSPDGSRILFTSQTTESGQAQLFIISANGSDLQQITSEGYNTGGEWSPDGSRILVNHHSGVGFDIAVLDVASGEMKLVASEPAWEVGARYSPDGQWIVFQGNMEGNYELYVMPAGGGEATRVTMTDSDEGNPQWTPDGSLYYQTAEGDTDLWYLDVEAALP
jgi:TolB protein